MNHSQVLPEKAQGIFSEVREVSTETLNLE